MKITNHYCHKAVKTCAFSVHFGHTRWKKMEEHDEHLAIVEKIIKSKE